MKTEMDGKKPIYVITPYFSRLMSIVPHTYHLQIYENIDPERYFIITMIEPDLEENEQTFVDSMKAQGVAGIIYYYYDRQSLAEKLKTAGIPTVIVDIEPENNPFDTVTGEDFDSAYRTGLNLLAGGYRKIGFFSQFEKGMSTSDQRERGLRQALRDNGAQYREEQFFHCREIGEQRYDRYSWLLSKAHIFLDENPDLEVVITANDDVAFPLLGAAQERKIRIPEDLKIISYGNYSLCSLPLIGLTSFEQHLKNYASEAAKLLMERIERRLPALAQRRTIRFDMIRRRTF